MIPCTGLKEKRLLRADPEAGLREACALTALADTGVPLKALRRDQSASVRPHPNVAVET